MNNATSQDSDKFILRFPSRELDQYIVRFPDGMRQALKDAAKRNGRSLNAEIVQRLSASFGEATGLSNEQLLQILAARLQRGE